MPLAQSATPIPGFAEPVNALSHLLGAGVFLILGFFLLRKARPHNGRVASLAIFAASTVFALSMSGVYHLLSPDTTQRFVLRHLDHAAIFMLIAGSFTAAHGILFRGFWRWGMLTAIWTLVITAISLKMVFFEDIPEWVGLALYLGMGWLGVISGSILWKRHGFACIRPVLFGGLAYSLGAIIDFIEWPTPLPSVIGPHELFHVAVLIALAFHWRFAWEHADGKRVDQGVVLTSDELTDLTPQTT